MPHVGGQKLKIINEYQILMEESDEKNQINAIEMTRRLKNRGIPAERKSVYKDMTTLINDHVRVYKGGSWNDRAFWLSPGARRFLDEAQSTNDIGFRCAMEAVGEPSASKR